MSRPVPSQIKKLRGTYRRDRAPANEPQPPAGRPACPSWLIPDAKAAWRRLAPGLAASGLLTKVDRNALARYCTLWARWRAAEDHIRENGSLHKLPSGYVATNPHVAIAGRLAVLLSKLEHDFGMTPAARTKIDVPPKPDGPDELERLIARDSAGTAGRIG